MSRLGTETEIETVRDEALRIDRIRGLGRRRWTFAVEWAGIGVAVGFAAGFAAGDSLKVELAGSGRGSDQVPLMRMLMLGTRLATARMRCAVDGR